LCCLSVVGASREFLVDGNSSLVGVLSAEEDALNDGIGKKEEAVIAMLAGGLSIVVCRF
jgi:hypothetical protein